MNGKCNFVSDVSKTFYFHFKTYFIIPTNFCYFYAFIPKSIKNWQQFSSTLAFLEGFYSHLRIPGFQWWFLQKSLPFFNFYIFPITFVDLHDNMTIKCRYIPYMGTFNNATNQPLHQKSGFLDIGPLSQLSLKY